MTPRHQRFPREKSPRFFPTDELGLGQADALDSVSSLARTFKVSTLVILRRILDARRISREQFEQAYAAESARFVERPRASGGDFYLTQAVRLRLRK